MIHAWKRLFVVVAVTVLIGSSIISTSATERRSQSLRLVAYTPLESMQTPSLAGIFHDLQLVKQLGFDGIKLWDATQLYQIGWLDAVLTEAGGLHLKVNVVFQFYNDQDNFPPSSVALGVMEETVVGMASITRAHQSVVWNTLFAPFDWNMSELSRQKIVQSQPYRDALEESLRNIKTADPTHQARVALDFDPTIGFPLLRNADGYGIMPYNLQEDNLDVQRVLGFIAYFASERKPVYIDEWGLHTTHVLSHGISSTEPKKASLLVDFAKFAEELHLDWTYFMLTDRVSSITFENGADWGILNMDRSPRNSAVLIQTFLQPH